ncbi:MAG: GNAT family N-acetyltransferase [Clostridiaceae bacterium]
MEVRELTPLERPLALALALDVFLQYVAPDYSSEGIETFRAFVSSGEATSALAIYGAFAEDTLAGMIATKNNGGHISLFFVDSRFQQRGIGRALMQQVIERCLEDAVTVHSSPYAKPIYEKLGFTAICEERLNDGIRYTPMKYVCQPYAQTKQEVFSMSHSLDQLLSLPKDALPEAAKSLTQEDVAALIPLLALKEDDIRYQAFLLLRERSAIASDVFPFWQTFLDKLKSENSYQRSIGLMLISENARWDTEGKTATALDAYFAGLTDEKPITVRQCVQGLKPIVSFHPELGGIVSERLISLDLTAIKETMRKLVLQDILDVLLLTRAQQKSEAVETYLLSALSGGLLDAKAKKLLQARLL